MPFLLLGAAVLGIWAPWHLWALLLALAVIAGYATGVLTGAAAVWLALLALSCHAYMSSTSHAARAVRIALRTAGLLGIVLLSLALGFHRLPSFHNRLIVAGMVLGPDDAPYDLWLNFDKTAAGLVVMGLCWGDFIGSFAALAAALKKAWAPIVATLTGLALLNLGFGYVTWEPKWSATFWLWASVNLLSTCMSEEAFFRAFLQRQLLRAFGALQWGAALAIALSAMLFGLAHFAGGWRYVLLAAAAGLGYGYVFYRTGRIEMAMLTHFSVNACQFLLFTYPYTRMR